MINKRKFSIKDTKKVLHKTGKHWAVISTVMLGLLAGGAVTAINGAKANADQNNQNGSDQDDYMSANHSSQYNLTTNHVNSGANSSVNQSQTSIKQNFNHVIGNAYRNNLVNTSNLSEQSRAYLHNPNGSSTSNSLHSNGGESLDSSAATVSSAAGFHQMLSAAAPASVGAHPLLGAQHNTDKTLTDQSIYDQHASSILTMRNLVNAINDDVKPNLAATSSAYNDLINIARPGNVAKFSNGAKLGSDLSTNRSSDTWIGEFNNFKNDMDVIKAHGDNQTVSDLDTTLDSVANRLYSKSPINIDLYGNPAFGALVSIPEVINSGLNQDLIKISAKKSNSYTLDELAGLFDGNGIHGEAENTAHTKLASKFANNDNANKAGAMLRALGKVVSTPTMSQDYNDVLNDIADLPNDTDTNTDNAYRDISSKLTGIINGLSSWSNPMKSKIVNGLSTLGAEAQTLAGKAPNNSAHKHSGSTPSQPATPNNQFTNSTSNLVKTLQDLRLSSILNVPTLTSIVKNNVQPSSNVIAHNAAVKAYDNLASLAGTDNVDQLATGIKLGRDLSTNSNLNTWIGEFNQFKSDVDAINNNGNDASLKSLDQVVDAIANRLYSGSVANGLNIADVINNGISTPIYSHDPFANHTYNLGQLIKLLNGSLNTATGRLASQVMNVKGLTKQTDKIAEIGSALNEINGNAKMQQDYQAMIRNASALADDNDSAMADTYGNLGINAKALANDLSSNDTNAAVVTGLNAIASEADAASKSNQSGSKNHDHKVPSNKPDNSSTPTHHQVTSAAVPVQFMHPSMIFNLQSLSNFIDNDIKPSSNAQMKAVSAYRDLMFDIGPSNVTKFILNGKALGKDKASNINSNWMGILNKIRNDFDAIDQNSHDASWDAMTQAVDKLNNFIHSNKAVKQYADSNSYQHYKLLNLITDYSTLSHYIPNQYMTAANKQAINKWMDIGRVMDEIANDSGKNGMDTAYNQMVSDASKLLTDNTSQSAETYRDIGNNAVKIANGLKANPTYGVDNSVMEAIINDLDAMGHKTTPKKPVIPNKPNKPVNPNHNSGKKTNPSNNHGNRDHKTPKNPSKPNTPNNHKKPVTPNKPNNPSTPNHQVTSVAIPVQFMHPSMIFNLQSLSDFMANDIEPSSNATTHAKAVAAYNDLMENVDASAVSDFITNGRPLGYDKASDIHHNWLGMLNRIRNDFDAIDQNSHDASWNTMTKAVDKLNNFILSNDIIREYINQHHSTFYKLSNWLNAYSSLEQYIPSKYLNANDKQALDKWMAIGRAMNEVANDGHVNGMDSDYNQMVSDASSLPTNNASQASSAYSNIGDNAVKLADSLQAHPTSSVSGSLMSDIISDLDAMGGKSASSSSSAKKHSNSASGSKSASASGKSASSTNSSGSSASGKSSSSESKGSSASRKASSSTSKSSSAGNKASGSTSKGSSAGSRTSNSASGSANSKAKSNGSKGSSASNSSNKSSSTNSSSSNQQSSGANSSGSSNSSTSSSTSNGSSSATNSSSSGSMNNDSSSNSNSSASSSVANNSSAIAKYASLASSAVNSANSASATANFAAYDIAEDSSIVTPIASATSSLAERYPNNSQIQNDNSEVMNDEQTVDSAMEVAASASTIANSAYSTASEFAIDAANAANSSTASDYMRSAVDAAKLGSADASKASSAASVADSALTAAYNAADQASNESGQSSAETSNGSASSNSASGYVPDSASQSNVSPSSQSSVIPSSATNEPSNSPQSNISVSVNPVTPSTPSNPFISGSSTSQSNNNVNGNSSSLSSASSNNQQSKYKGRRIVRVSRKFGYFYVTRTCLAHKHISSVGKVKDYGAILRRGMLVKIQKVFAVKIGNHTAYRYEVEINHHRYYVTGNHHFTSNAYIQPREMKRAYKSGHRHYYKAIIKRPCCLYDSADYDSANMVKPVKRNSIVNIKRIFFIGKKGMFMTRFELTNGLFITANKSFISLI